MPKQIVLCFIMMALSLMPTHGQEKKHEEEQPEAQLPDGPGKDVFIQVCSTCHTTNNVIGRGYAEDGWTAVVGTMASSYGAQFTDDQFDVIVQYLTKNFGPPPDKINVNKVTALDFRNWLHMTQEQAEAVISYRAQNGDFKSLDDLKKVPGIDQKMLDAKKDHLTF